MNRAVPLPTISLHLRFVPAPPRDGGCVACGRREAVEMTCEHCGAWMHWRCFVTTVADLRDLRGIHADDVDDPANWRVLLCPGCRS